jgi:hypothetical protein
MAFLAIKLTTIYPDTIAETAVTTTKTTINNRNSNNACAPSNILVQTLTATASTSAASKMVRTKSHKPDILHFILYRYAM